MPYPPSSTTTAVSGRRSCLAVASSPQANRNPPSPETDTVGPATAAPSAGGNADPSGAPPRPGGGGDRVPRRPHPQGVGEGAGGGRGGQRGEPVARDAHVGDDDG